MWTFVSSITSDPSPGSQLAANCIQDGDTQRNDGCISPMRSHLRKAKKPERWSTPAYWLALVHHDSTGPPKDAHYVHQCDFFYGYVAIGMNMVIHWMQGHIWMHLLVWYDGMRRAIQLNTTSFDWRCISLTALLMWSVSSCEERIL